MRQDVPQNRVKRHPSSVPGRYLVASVSPPVHFFLTAKCLFCILSEISYALQRWGRTCFSVTFSLAGINTQAATAIKWGVHDIPSGPAVMLISTSSAMNGGQLHALFGTAYNSTSGKHSLTLANDATILAMGEPSATLFSTKEKLGDYEDLFHTATILVAEDGSIQVGNPFPWSQVTSSVQEPGDDAYFYTVLFKALNFDNLVENEEFQFAFLFSASNPSDDPLSGDQLALFPTGSGPGGGLIWYGVTPVPEPSAVALFGIGIAIFGLRRKRLAA